MEASSLRRQSLHQGPPEWHRDQLSRLLNRNQAFEESRLGSLRDRSEGWAQLERSHAGLSTAVELEDRTADSGSAYIACPDARTMGPHEEAQYISPRIEFGQEPVSGHRAGASKRQVKYQGCDRAKRGLKRPP